ncbi:fasciclin domain-containing protein [Leptolyngbya sp. FACHB-36]|uniref:fasciclin domain-containing protein n=1 Tax=Leptolyngbya sp. FACHB-36 TaxID=2692808 RepID=UPI0016804B33|nr:fasciclin domain-containing protein [Leptolyngbya sp. FACHB-36]MBD2021301.1 fasciclin domain-containing protein [Leptolyngbya sp. FACHB-36]
MRYSLKFLAGLAVIGFGATTSMTAVAQQSSPGSTFTDTQPSPSGQSPANSNQNEPSRLAPSGPTTGDQQNPDRNSTPNSPSPYPNNPSPSNSRDNEQQNLDRTSPNGPSSGDQSAPSATPSGGSGSGTDGQTRPDRNYPSAPSRAVPGSTTEDPNSNRLNPTGSPSQGGSQTTPTAPSRSDVPATTASGSIDSIVRQSASFELFNALLRVADSRGAGLGARLDDGTYTVFAPTDTAFAALPEGTIKRLVQPENQDLLVRILSNHIVKGEVLSSAIQSGSKEAIEGDSLNLQAGAQGVTVNNAQVIQADIRAENGVIHAINQVILPSGVQAGLAPRTSGNF